MLASRSLSTRALVAARPVAGRRVGQTLVRRVQTDSKSEPKGLNLVLQTDHSTSVKHLMHKVYLGLFGALPVAFFLAPSPIVKPLDVALGVVIPIHAHVGMNAVISDYVPPAMRGSARFALLGVTAVTTLGLLRWNIAGEGMTASVKQLWKQPESKH